ncbi:glycogen debranching protein GlgX [Sphingobium algorifonticola]|uniref:Glycogen debranching enzyme GlgX n=1 Tax=Sphingobium algorifonticola TaxID=2008318 RepID=A0A437J7F1_9SPHN|nr:glycogen debranching protein GlgX [Sphingobium algorifonticola]RVT40944.1 glycogen debranching enzyme GlgX [Sphingobium algorifonticola]
MAAERRALCRSLRIAGAVTPESLPTLGPQVEGDGTRFAVWSAAEALWVCLFDGAREVARMPMARQDGIFSLFAPGIGAGAHYGLRADGPYDPAAGQWFDPDKLLLDPYATRIDRAFTFDPRLAARRGEGGDTAALMPKGILEAPRDRLRHAPPVFVPGGLIYEVQVRGFSMRHPDVPPDLRGTLRALAHPAIVAHLKRLNVAAVELMPIHAWIDERHLPPLGLTNAWGYNPVSYFALDPRLAPGGIADLCAVTAVLHDAGIGVILDMVYNHDGESDDQGPTLSLRGLDARRYFRHDLHGRLINDTGTGNSVDCNHPVSRRLILDSMRHLVRYAGIDGFRFDLAPALGRLPEGFRSDAPLLREMASDPLLADRVMIAEPWDIGPGGYQLGAFAENWLEWNDRFRDDVRRFWRGDKHMLGALATRIAGSADIFRHGKSRSINFLAAHDGFTLADVTAYADRHNDANGEGNRDGHGENYSWNNGVEGPSDDATVQAARRADVMAMLSTLFLSRGTIMLTAGDEFGRTQQGNNNAYAQDNAIGWIDWTGRDAAIEAHSVALSALRAEIATLRDITLLEDGDVIWMRADGQAMTVADWEAADGDLLAFRLMPDGPCVFINRRHEPSVFATGDRMIDVPARAVRVIA